MDRSEYSAKLDQWVDAHRDEMTADIAALVRIDSTKGEAKEGMPFGEGPAAAVAAMQELMAKYGFATKNYDNYCVAGDLAGEGRKSLDILAHLDVVPVSEDWTKTKPFEPLVEGNFMYGRGTADDKGPAVAALYAMRAIRELGLPLRSGVRLICGSDEECGSSDLEHYYSIEKEAEYTFSPDANFPLINIEKARLEKKIVADLPEDYKAPCILEIEAGSKSNVVPGYADAAFHGLTEEQIREAVEETSAEIKKINAELAAARTTGATGDAGGNGDAGATGDRCATGDAGAAGDRCAAGDAGATGDRVATGDRCATGDAAGKGKPVPAAAIPIFKWEVQGDRELVHVKGQTGHAAMPDNGSVNALTALLLLIQKLPLANTKTTRTIRALGELFPYGDFHGKALGVDLKDEESGELTISLDVLSFQNGHLTADFDSRAPLCATEENLTEKMRAELAAKGLTMEEGGMTPAHYVSADSPLVKKLLGSYEHYFGKPGKPLAIGGGTYVHELKNGVAFGCEVEGFDNRMHGDDEVVDLDVLVKSAKIFADAILQICG